MGNVRFYGSKVQYSPIVGNVRFYGSKVQYSPIVGNVRIQSNPERPYSSAIVDNVDERQIF